MSELGTYEDLKPFYVYELVDPRNGAVFYIGKGQGERALDHAKNPDPQTQKGKRILEIQNAGKEPIPRIVARFDKETQAYAVEAVLMHYSHDFSQLTNDQSGHDSTYVRPKGDYSVIPGIDIAEKQKGDDKKRFERLAKVYKVEEFATELKTHIERRLHIQLSGPKLTDSNTLMCLFYDCQTVDIRIQIPVKTRKADVGIRAKSGDTKSVKALGKRYKELAVRNGGQYAYLPSHRSPDPSDLIQVFQDYRTLVEADAD